LRIPALLRRRLLPGRPVGGEPAISPSRAAKPGCPRPFRPPRSARPSWSVRRSVR